MSQALAGLTFPTDSTTSRRPFDPADLVSAVCPDPRLKVLQLATAPLSPPGGASEAASAARRPPAMGTLVDACLERLPRYDNCNAAVATLGAMAVARGVAGEPPEAKVQASLASLTQVSQVSRKSCQPCASLTRPFPLPLLSHLILSCPFISTGVLHPPPVFDPPPPNVTSRPDSRSSSVALHSTFRDRRRFLGDSRIRRRPRCPSLRRRRARSQSPPTGRMRRARSRRSSCTRSYSSQRAPTCTTTSSTALTRRRSERGSPWCSRSSTTIARSSQSRP